MNVEIFYKIIEKLIKFELFRIFIKSFNAKLGSRSYSDKSIRNLMPSRTMVKGSQIVMCGQEVTVSHYAPCQIFHCNRYFG